MRMQHNQAANSTSSDDEEEEGEIEPEPVSPTPTATASPGVFVEADSEHTAELTLDLHTTLQDTWLEETNEEKKEA